MMNWDAPGVSQAVAHSSFCIHHSSFLLDPAGCPLHAAAVIFISGLVNVIAMQWATAQVVLIATRNLYRTVYESNQQTLTRARGAGGDRYAGGVSPGDSRLQ